MMPTPVRVMGSPGVMTTVISPTWIGRVQWAAMGVPACALSFNTITLISSSTSPGAYSSQSTSLVVIVFGNLLFRGVTGLSGSTQSTIGSTIVASTRFTKTASHSYIISFVTGWCWLLQMVIFLTFGIIPGMVFVLSTFLVTRTRHSILLLCPSFLYFSGMPMFRHSAVFSSLLPRWDVWFSHLANMCFT